MTIKLQEGSMSEAQQMSQHSDRFISTLTKRTAAIILAGGRGSRLKNLTDWRAKPAVQFGGKYRIIDFPCLIALIPAYAASMSPRNTRHKV